jgi:hypothetical protein
MRSECVGWKRLREETTALDAVVEANLMKKIILVGTQNIVQMRCKLSRGGVRGNGN